MCRVHDVYEVEAVMSKKIIIMECILKLQDIVTISHAW